MRIILAFAIALIATSAWAQAPKPRPLNIFQPRTDSTDGVQIGGGGDKGLQDLIGALDAKLLPDLKYAKRLADKANNTITGQCWDTWIAIIESRQQAVQDEKGQPIDMPDPALITKFEQLVELRNQLQPTSDFMVKCSPVAQMVRRDMIGFIGIVISGGAGLATLVPGL